ncbi:MAG: DNA polymerase/3'-5' exonuclease PolX [Halobacteriales archaeon]
MSGSDRQRAGTNDAVAALFEEYADRLEAQGDDYRPRSYRRAAENIREYPESVETLAAEGENAIKSIEGVGDSIAGKIAEYVRTGTIERVEEAREELPVDMEALTRVEGVGPKTVGDLHRELEIADLDDLEAAAREGKIRELDGYGTKTEANILENLEFARESGERALLGEARPVAEGVLAHLRACDAVVRCEVAGSLRRWRETVGDVDVLAVGMDHEAAVEHLLEWEGVRETIEAGSTKASVRAGGSTDSNRLTPETDRGIRVDVRVVDPDEWGSALQYFTGSKEHNVRLRTHAIERDLKINEYGVFDVSDVAAEEDGQRAGVHLAGETEADVYEALGLDSIPPELREGDGEIEAALDGELPDLIEAEEIRGDLHTHTEWSDGGNTIEEMIEGAAAFGHEYLAITDHATGPGVVGGMGLDDSEIHDQIDAIGAAAAEAEIDVFAGIEANIDADGGVSVGKDALSALDLVVASPHAGLSGDGTDRIVGAIEHREVDVIGHPSGRIINARPGIDLDVPAIAEAAARTDTALEVNANPSRLDLWSEAVRVAVEAGAPIVIDTDAHTPAEYDLLEYGVHTARRGWAETADVLNARDADGLQSFLE